MQQGASAWKRVKRAALGVVLLLLLLGLLLGLAPPGFTGRALQTPGAVALAAGAPGWAYAFYLGDGLYALAGLTFFLALGKVARGPRWLLGLGLAAALGKAAFDLGENILLAQAVVQSAAQAVAGGAADPASLPTMTALKQAAGGLCALAFARLHPRDDGLGLAIALLLLLGGLATLAGLALAPLGQANALFLFFTALLAAWNARRHAGG